jgi:outer membrane protein OmpA-like peptidoglycan-associated protein
MTKLYPTIAQRLAFALLVGTLIGTGRPALAGEVSAPEIIHALTAAPKTRGLSASEPSAADRKFIETLHHRTRSLTETERERIIPILETRPSIDVEVYFDFDSSVITEQAKPQLNEIADALRNAALKGPRAAQRPRGCIWGATRGLLERRAEAVKRYLVENFNIPAENLSTAGFGKRVPKNKVDPYAPENRRVQIANMASQKKAYP